MPRLLIINGPNRGVSYELGDRTRIGRLGENEIQVPDPNVSRIHAEIIRDGDGYSVYDRGSKNGVVVNGVAVPEGRLASSDEITIGSATFIFDGPITIQNSRYSCTPVLYLPETEAEPALAIAKDGAGGTHTGHNNCAALLAQVCATATANRPAALAALCQGIDACFAVDHAVLFLRDYPNGRLNPIEAAPRRKSVAVRESLLEESAREAKLVFGGQKVDPAVVELYLAGDTDADSNEPAKPIDAVSWLCAPVCIDGGTNGVILIVRYDDRGFTQEDAESLQTAAAFAGLAIQATRPAPQPTSSENAALDAEQRSASSRSLRMQEIYNSARRSASGNAPILITGETGCGKETLARFIHESSERALGAFVVVQCAAIAPENIESELFGTEVTSEDGQVTILPGKIDDAAGGTLYLQEVGELPLDFQPRLLRFLQDQAYSRTNSDCAVMADVKLIGSTSIDLAAAVRVGNFREDLWYRLNVVPFHMPPLRERREDIAPLLDFFVHYYSIRFNRRIIGANDSAIALLQKYDWPGNIRELNNAVERAVLLAESKVLSTSDFAHIDEARRQLNAKSDLERKRDTRPLAEVERQHIIVALKKHNFNQARAAEALGLHRNTLRNKIIEYGIEVPK